MPVKVSILITTHNRAPILAQTLESLKRLRLPDGYGVELVVVANACTDDTQRVVAGLAPAMPFPTRCVAEEQVGIGPGRNRCVVESIGEICAFLDDDVWVAEDWLEALLEVYQNYPAADVVGGRVELWWQEVQRPDWLTRAMEGYLSTKDLGDRVMETDPYGMIGANFSFRRTVFDAIGPFRPDLGRIGNSGLGAGDEGEWLLRAENHGCRFFYSPASVKHWVAKKRLEESYMRGVAFGVAESRVLVRARFGPPSVLRVIAGHMYLVAAHSALTVIARLRGSTGDRIRHRMLVSSGFGGLWGCWQRLREGGRSRRGVPPGMAPVVKRVDATGHTA